MKQQKSSIPKSVRPWRIEDGKVIVPEESSFTSAQLMEIVSALLNEGRECKVCGKLKSAQDFRKGRLTCKVCENIQKRRKRHDEAGAKTFFQMSAGVAELTKFLEERQR